MKKSQIYNHFIQIGSGPLNWYMAIDRPIRAVNMGESSIFVGFHIITKTGDKMSTKTQVSSTNSFKSLSVSTH